MKKSERKSRLAGQRAEALIEGYFADGLLFLLARFIISVCRMELETAGRGSCALWTEKISSVGILLAAAGFLFHTVLFVYENRAFLFACKKGKSRSAPGIGIREKAAIDLIRADAFEALSAELERGASLGAAFPVLTAACEGTLLEADAAKVKEALFQGRPFLLAVTGSGLLSANAEGALRRGAGHRQIADILDREHISSSEICVETLRRRMFFPPWICIGLLSLTLMGLFVRSVL